MKKSGILFFAIFLATVFNLAHGSAALAKVGGIMTIGGETLPVDFEPVYDANDKLVAYVFNVEGSRGSVHGRVPLPQPSLQQDGQGQCPTITIGPIVQGANKPDASDVTVTFILDPMEVLPFPIPAGTAITATQSVQGTLAANLTVTPLDVTLWQYHLGPPDTSILPGIGDLRTCSGVLPCDYGPFTATQSAPAPTPPGSWTQWGYGYSFTLSGQATGPDVFDFTSELTLEVCPRPGVPAFSQQGLVIFLVLLLLSSVLVIRWKRRRAG